MAKFITYEAALDHVKQKGFEKHNLIQSMMDDLIIPCFIYNGRLSPGNPENYGAPSFLDGVHCFNYQGFITPLNKSDLLRRLNADINLDTPFLVDKVLQVKVLDSGELHKSHDSSFCLSYDSSNFQDSFTFKDVLFSVNELDEHFISDKLPVKASKAVFNKKEVFKIVVPTVLRYLGHDPDNLPDADGNDGPKKAVEEYLGNYSETKILITSKNTFNGYWDEFFSKRKQSKNK